MLLRIIAAILALLPLAAARAAEPVTSVAYRIDYGGWLTVSATVDGRGPYDFIVDTGASQSLVFRNLDAVHAFPPSGGPPQEVLGLLSSGKFPTFVVGDVAVGGARIDDLVTVILPDWNVAGRAPQGVLGLDFLTRYRMVFDARALQISFYSPDADIGAAATWKRVPLRTEEFGRGAGELFVVDARLDGRPVPFLLDLGASGTIINKTALGTIARTQRLGLGVRAGGSDIAGRIKDALDTEIDARAVRISRMQAGRAVWYRQVVLVQNADILKELGVAGTPFGLFGSDLLRDRNFVLDLANKELLIGSRPR